MSRKKIDTSRIHADPISFNLLTGEMSPACIRQHVDNSLSCLQSPLIQSPNSSIEFFYNIDPSFDNPQRCHCRRRSEASSIREKGALDVSTHHAGPSPPASETARRHRSSPPSPAPEGKKKKKKGKTVKQKRANKPGPNARPYMYRRILPLSTGGSIGAHPPRSRESTDTRRKSRVVGVVIWQCIIMPSPGAKLVGWSDR
ncbi:hypothetical protein B0J12DRAFT_358473 [Macrophomina phaseolina]|uniref:Uncharacterized protein n=1 Tax=Macrophomina phaseolina TaxID=35725 RepID=A0ABQ8FUS3_9PEZI|nr:hypothetical protein B0J12DRAFT_358473 [Macrophomina phaseolina]